MTRFSKYGFHESHGGTWANNLKKKNSLNLCADGFLFFFKNLCEALCTLPHLIHLDVHSNLITSAGLVSLSDTLRTNNDALKVSKLPLC